MGWQPGASPGYDLDDRGRSGPESGVKPHRRPGSRHRARRVALFRADGDAIAYAWTLTCKPQGSKAALFSTTAVRPTLTLDVAGAYVAQLVVTDSKGKSSEPSFVTVSTGRQVAGRASAGPAQFVAQGGTARLDADGTYLPSGAPTNAGFALLSAPAGSAAKLVTGPDARSAFTLDLSGIMSCKRRSPLRAPRSAAKAIMAATTFSPVRSRRRRSSPPAMSHRSPSPATFRRSRRAPPSRSTARARPTLTAIR
jgi:hypothetical protein